MKHFLILLILFPCLLQATIGDSKEEFVKKYGKPTKIMSKGQVMFYKKAKVEYMAMFHENKSVVFEVDYGRKLDDKEVMAMANKAFPGVKIAWYKDENCWRDKKNKCVIRYTAGTKLAFIDAVGDYARLKANRKK
ncbi:MAG: hypothetical protein NE328_12890 [Lentisphaeraceae bacterium]|nr:hypothetical protein [Lentisphaeraceae bacterium]